ncbi:MAG: hypothetical protein ACRDLN_01530 [Solirubrobacteraceae bacterium]
MIDQPRRRLSRAELDALRFAGRRQLARWSSKPQLSPNQQAQRGALKQAVRILEDDAFTGGCDLHVPDEEKHNDV